MTTTFNNLDPEDTLQDEIKLALTATNYSNFISTVILSDAWDKARAQQLDSTKYPAVVICPPVLESSEGITTGVTRMTFAVQLGVFQSKGGPDDAAKQMSLMKSYIRTALSQYTSANWQALGIGKNTVTVQDEGEATYGNQDQCYLLTVGVVCHVAALPSFTVTP